VRLNEDTPQRTLFQQHFQLNIRIANISASFYYD